MNEVVGRFIPGRLSVEKPSNKRSDAKGASSLHTNWAYCGDCHRWTGEYSRSLRGAIFLPCQKCGKQRGVVDVEYEATSE